METLYIVKRPFKTGGNVFLLGSVITDPSEIRLFRSKFREGKIIEVKEQDLPRIAEYVESRTGTNPATLFAESIEAKKQEIKRVADEAKTIADEVKRVAEEEAKKVADEVKRVAEEEAKIVADEVKRVAEEAKKVVVPAKAVIIKGR